MPVHDLDHVNLKAPRDELDKLCRFYCELLGLTVGERPAFGSDGYWLYAGDRAVVHLSVADRAAGTAAGTSLDHFAFACSGQAELEKRLVDAGIEFRRATVPGLGIGQLFFDDPAGNGVELNFCRD